MKTYQKTKKLYTQRPGFTMIELMLVVLIGGIIVLAGVMGYNKLYIPTKADSEVKKIGMVIGGIERVKNSYNGGAYLASNNNVPISDIQMLVDAMGGPNAIKDIPNWTYECPKGNNKTVYFRIQTNGYSQEVKRLIEYGVKNQFLDWNFYSDNKHILLYKHNINCQ